MRISSFPVFKINYVLSVQKIIRIIILIIFSLTFLNSVFFILIGVYKSIHTYIMVAQGRVEGKPGIFITESLDSFWEAFFLFIFSIGISKLFLPKLNLLNGYCLSRQEIDNLSHLKYKF